MFTETIKNINIKTIVKINIDWLSIFILLLISQHKISYGKKNINDLNANEFPVSHLKLIGTNTNINVKSNKIVSVKNAKFNISG